MTMNANTESDNKNTVNSFADLLQANIVQPVKARFEKQHGELVECRGRIEALEKRLRELEKALSEIDWGE